VAVVSTDAEAVQASTVLALNQGSSSLKFGVFRASEQRLDGLLSGEAESVADMAGLLGDSQLPAPAVVGHRIVHGGPLLRHHCVIDDAVLEQLNAAAAFAPLHTPAALALIRQAQQQFPDAVQVACFDTNFHIDMPDAARVLPIPRALQQEGIQRYGFHGLSCESIVQQLAADLPDRLVIAHLGNGASVTAVRHGRSIDTSMGLTPSGGVIMGTRSGDLDPGVLLYLMRERALDADGIEALLNHQSGLLGISGLDSDMRRLHGAAPTNADAALAIHMFAASVAKQVAGMITALEGIDMLVFTGGIGENDAPVRAAICRGLAWFGITLDDAHNRAAINPVSDAASRCAVRVLASEEDRQIARHAWDFRAQSGAQSGVSQSGL
jgi:acetate kinase